MTYAAATTGVADPDSSNQQQQESLLPAQPAPWWEASGLDPSALLLKYSSRLSATAGASLQGNLLSTVGRVSVTGSPQVAGSSRRATKERSPSAASVKKARPSTAAANRPGSAAVSAGDSSAGAAATAADKRLGHSSRRTTGSKAPRASQHTANGSSSSTAATTAAGGRTAVTDEELLARLLAAAAPKEAAAVFATLGEVHAASVIGLACWYGKRTSSSGSTDGVLVSGSGCQVWLGSRDVSDGR